MLIVLPAAEDAVIVVLEAVDLDGEPHGRATDPRVAESALIVLPRLLRLIVKKVSGSELTVRKGRVSKRLLGAAMRQVRWRYDRKEV